MLIFRKMLTHSLAVLALTLSVSSAATMTVLLPSIKDFVITPNSILLKITTKGSPIRIESGQEPTPQCITDALETPGQAWEVHLSAGGVSLLAEEKVANGLAVTPQSRGAVLLSTITGTRPVNVLVIDKLGITDLKMDETGAQVLTFHLRHGALVMAHLGAVLEGAGFKPYGNTYKKGGQSIRLFGIDLDAFKTGFPTTTTGKVLPTTTVLANRLDKSIIDLEISPTDPLIVNMSFAILPCELQTHYFQLRDQMYALNPPVRLPFRVYLDAVAIMNGHSGDPEAYIKSIISPPNFSDPLRTWIAKQQKTWDNRFVAVAASGNYGLPFQTMPAAWPEVLGVGATTVKPFTSPASPSLWSDRGDVLEVGEWFSFRGVQDAPSLAGIVSVTSASGGVSVNQNNFAYLGTSFAAPTVTAALAVAMGRPTSHCFVGNKFKFPPLNPKGGNVSFLNSFQICK